MACLFSLTPLPDSRPLPAVSENRNVVDPSLIVSMDTPLRTLSAAVAATICSRTAAAAAIASGDRATSAA